MKIVNLKNLLRYAASKETKPIKPLSTDYAGIESWDARSQPLKDCLAWTTVIVNPGKFLNWIKYHWDIDVTSNEYGVVIDVPNFQYSRVDSGITIYVDGVKASECTAAFIRGTYENSIEKEFLRENGYKMACPLLVGDYDYTFSARCYTNFWVPSDYVITESDCRELLSINNKEFQNYSVCNTTDSKVLLSTSYGRKKLISAIMQACHLSSQSFKWMLLFNNEPAELTMLFSNYDLQFIRTSQANGAAAIYAMSKVGPFSFVFGDGFLTSVCKDPVRCKPVKEGLVLANVNGYTAIAFEAFNTFGVIVGHHLDLGSEYVRACILPDKSGYSLVEDPRGRCFIHKRLLGLSEDTNIPSSTFIFSDTESSVGIEDTLSFLSMPDAKYQTRVLTETIFSFPSIRDTSFDDEESSVYKSISGIGSSTKPTARQVVENSVINVKEEDTSTEDNATIWNKVMQRDDWLTLIRTACDSIDDTMYDKFTLLLKAQL